MKRILPRAAVPARPFATWYSPICIAAFLATISASATTDAQTTTEGLSLAERWIVERVTAGQEANLDTDLNADHTKRFPKKEDRKISADFLENLLMGTLPGVKPHRHGVQIKGACIDEPVDLKNAQIPGEVWLEYFQFNGSVTFAGANFAANASFKGSTFNAEAKFNHVKVGGDATFNAAVFEGPVDFTGADIAGNLGAQGVKLQNKQAFVRFTRMKVGGEADFNAAVFQGQVDFFGADIEQRFSVQGAKFQNEKGAFFWSMKIRGDAFLDASFEGPVFFFGTDIAGNCQAAVGAWVKFQKGAFFDRMKIGGNFSINAEFAGPASFAETDIAGDFSAGAKFLNKKNRASFNHLKVGGTASFNHAVFEGPVDLRYADFGLLDLSGASWPNDPSQFRLEGMSYKTILADPKDQSKSHKALVRLADQADYSANVYSRLEEFFLRQGYRRDGDEAFISGKVRERKEYFRNHDWFGWLASWMLDLLVGYGRRPWQAGIPCAVLIALGCAFFSPKKMEPQNLNEAPRVYSRFWYSLGLFLPFVDLQAGKVWKPKADQTFLRNYMRVHILLGWILIPLVLAAITGLIK